jgi:hypothetical protein
MSDQFYIPAALFIKEKENRWNMGWPPDVMAERKLLALPRIELQSSSPRPVKGKVVLVLIN